MSTRVMKALLSGCLLAAWIAPTQAQAQSVSCTGVAAWNASTIYNPGDKLVYQGKLYQAQIAIWNAPPTQCPSCGWYLDLGTCGNVTPADTVRRAGVHAQRGGAAEELHLGDSAVAVGGVRRDGDGGACGESRVVGRRGQRDGRRLVGAAGAACA